MNYKQEEHRIRLFGPSTYRDAFTGLWNTIARQQHFLKLTIPSSASLHQEIHRHIHQRDGSISPYSSHVFESYHILYQKGNTVLVTNSPTTSLGTFFAVEDADCPHRYFIAFAFSVGAMTESITGLIAYFNEEGHCYSDQTIVCQRVLTTYDMRNGLLRENQVFFYHQSLVFTQVHRDTRKLLLYVNYVPYDTDLIEDHTSYYTSYNLPLNHEYAIALHARRFLFIPLLDSTLLFDLGTLERKQEIAMNDGGRSGGAGDATPTRYFILQSYLTSAPIAEFLSIGSLFPEKEYSDGYPLSCIQCYRPTVAASYSYKRLPYVSLHSGLGSSYCPDCRIRYSDSHHQWQCAEIRLDGSICGGYLLDSECRSSALHSSDQSVLILYDPPYRKYPYRKRIRIQWTPSEEANACARASHSMDFYATDTPPKAEDVL